MRIYFTNFLFLNLLLLVLIPHCAVSQETSVMIRVKSKDAKFVGSSIGGAKIIVREELTGEILAEGITEGSTGDTEKILKTPRSRNTALTDKNTAGFLARLAVDKPVFVTVEAYAPLNKKQARVQASVQLWVIPGKNILGDGLILEVPGFIVDILSPQTHERMEANQQIALKANVVLMCGCPVTIDGLWDANAYEVQALISKEGEAAKQVALKPLDKPSTFGVNTTLSSGNYEIIIFAYDPATGNTGVDKINILVN